MRVDILALDSVFDLGLSAVLDVLRTANELIEMSGLDVARFERADRRRPESGQDVARPRRAGAPVGRERRTASFIPAIGFKMLEQLEAALTRPDVRRRRRRLAAMVAARRDGRRRLHRDVRARRVRAARRAAGDDDVVARAALSQTLSRGRAGRIEHDREIGPLRHCRRRVRPCGSRAVAGAERQPAARVADSEISARRLATAAVRVRAWPTISCTTIRSCSASRAGREAGWRAASRSTTRRRPSGASKRTLARHMQDVLGKSPLSYFQSLRVERAVHF